MNLKSPSRHPVSDRLLSLDALRGFTMFWITGGSLLFNELAKLSDWGFLKALSDQLKHAQWQGFIFLDLIFPLFIFITGVAIPFALLAAGKKDVPKSILYKKIIQRTLVLVLLGLLYNGILSFDFKNFRFASVLAQIGIAYFFASVIALNFKKIKLLVIWVTSLLSGYGLIQLFIPVPGFGAGVLTPEGSINGYIDRLLMPGRLYGGSYDPEGWLCIISAIAIALMGVIAGLIISNKTITHIRKVLILSTTGLIMFILGAVINLWYPVIKNIWTSTFNLYAGGISFMILALFYLIIEGWKYNKWCFYFRIIGLNSITIYLGVKILDFKHTSAYLFSGLAGQLGDFGPVFQSIGYLAIIWLFLYFLYKNKIFLRV